MKRLVLALTVLLSGCCTLPETVEVPIAVPCTPPPVAQRHNYQSATLKQACRLQRLNACTPSPWNN